MTRYFYIKDARDNKLVVCERDEDANLLMLHYIGKRAENGVKIHAWRDKQYREVTCEEVEREKMIRFRIISFSRWANEIYCGAKKDGVMSYRARLDKSGGKYDD